MQQLVLASNNAGKITELSALLAPLNLEVIPQATFGVTPIKETGTTFVENALMKARHAAKMSGLPALADDSGLVVPVLNGEPGIYSARYAGETASAYDNIQKLLTSLKGVPEEKRQAWFYCVIVVISHADDPIPLICEGKWHGTILTSAKGTEGFGYDPIFYVPSEHKSAAELSLAVKNTISHRAMALQILKNKIAEK